MKVYFGLCQRYLNLLETDRLTLFGYLGPGLDTNAVTNWMIAGKLKTIDIKAYDMATLVSFELMEKYAEAVQNPSLILYERSRFRQAFYAPNSKNTLEIISRFVNFEV
ncbi:hypothetical protein PENTCL1PPCAC_21302, partial [Pristionchus entomophagus]